MDLKFDKDTNVCEYLNEHNGALMHVLSNENGLWFNLNDAFKLFSSIKADKLWFSKNLTNADKKWVDFKRKGRDAHEVFIPEQKVHELIAKIQESHNQNVDFIYGIISDYDMTCINIKDMELNVEERIALHALKAECGNFNKRAEKYMSVLEGKTSLNGYHEEFMQMLDNELKAVDAKYDNETCPEDLRQKEEREKIIKRREEYLKRREASRMITDYDVIHNANEYLKDGMNDIYNFIDKYEEEYNTIEDQEDEIQEIGNNEPPYDDMYWDYHEIKSDMNYVEEVIIERKKRCEALREAMQQIEKEHKEKKEKSIVDLIFEKAMKEE